MSADTEAMGSPDRGDPEDLPTAEATDCRDHAVPGGPADVADHALLGTAQIRALADTLGIRPTKQWGQNFVIDKGTVRRIVRAADLRGDDVVYGPMSLDPA